MDKKNIYEKLGAVWFQKVVFKVEDLKFKFIDRFCPNIGDWYSNICDKKALKLCSKAKDEEEKNKIRLKYNFKKMAFKKEIVEKKNRNYHMDLNNASNFSGYLHWNKKVHKNGMLWNLFWIAGSCLSLPLVSGIGLGFISFWLGYNIISLGVNFQCVNLQNYNICRFEENKETLVKIENRQKEKDVKNYAKVGETIYKNIENNIESPKSVDVVSKINDVEELRQLKNLALEIKKQREQEISFAKKLVKK